MSAKNDKLSVNGTNGKPVKQAIIRPKKDPRATQFKPGICPNPKGRPRRAESLGEAIRDFVDKINPKDKQARTFLELLIERLYWKDPKTLLAYGFGKPVETGEVKVETDLAPDQFSRASDEYLQQIIESHGRVLFGGGNGGNMAIEPKNCGSNGNQPTSLNVEPRIKEETPTMSTPPITHPPAENNR